MIKRETLLCLVYPNRQDSGIFAGVVCRNIPSQHRDGGDITSLRAQLVCDEGLVYKITKAIFENIDMFRASYPSVKKYSIDAATKGPLVSFHPGAIKTYKERGVWSGK